LAPFLSGWRSPTTKGPGYRALAERLRLLILDGRLPVDTVLPSERALAEAIGASRTTTTAAYRLLREDGFAHGSHGAGTWTALPASEPAGAPYPLALDGLPGAADGRGDLSSAAAAAPPEVHTAYVAALAELPRYLPGHGYVTAGVSTLRSRIAAYYTARGLPTVPEEIMVTAGALHAMHLTLNLLVHAGDRVLVEHPTYPIIIDASRRAGARPVPLPVEDGWDAEQARIVLRQTGARFAALIPDCHNPTGQIMDTPTREAMASALADAGVMTIADETTQSLDLRAEFGQPVPPSPEPPFAAVARPGSVITLGSMSKSVWGGLRIGWIRAERSLIRQLAGLRAADDLAGPVLEQLAAAHLLDQLDVLVARRRVELARQCRALQAAMAAHLPDWEVPTPQGGMVVWCKLPVPRSSELVSSARQLGVLLNAGPRYGVDGAFESRLRIPFARPPEQLAAAMGLIARAWYAPGAHLGGPGAGSGLQADVV
jgi:DNA-binding transcriptional MocR family regulator